MLIKLKYKKLPPRASDQKVFVADISKINSKIGWMPKVTADEGLTEMLSWISNI